MKNDLSNYNFDPEKREHLTRAALEKMLREIKAALSKNKKIKVVITSE
jgi:hypothetical protein